VAEAISQQPDPELVRTGAPALLLFVDSLLASAPDDAGLLRAAASAYTGYTQAFLMADADQARAAILTERAKGYALRLLDRRSSLATARRDGPDRFEAALQRLGRRDVEDLYVAGGAWLAWILVRPDSMAALAELPQALAVMRRVLALDGTHAAGGVHVIFGIYYASQPPGAGQDLPRSREHFQRALALAGDNNLMASVLYAEFYAKAAGEKQLFTDLLSTVLARKPGTDEAFAFDNALARERARELLGRVDELF
jgi:hypothetical protein